ncbi:hypothetical protein SBRCBS47491_000558 [Sporothrix bragantina]|uniref:Up-regulated during septation protein 1 domain-containing protein n=1 Tax=Sporothrix bragantina TaxID=671064 RepID=A0ABP0AR73_9PEZI
MSLLLEQQQPQQQQKQAPLPAPPVTDDKDNKDTKDKQPFLWRMHSQAERKYQLFPKDKQQQPAAGKSLDPEQAFALAMGGNTANNNSNTSTGNNNIATAANGNPLRLRIKEHTLIRRRKVSVPELGPMTTVQEVAMDSPTIPGRPPLHERSISAPGNSWKNQQHHHHHLVECMLPQTMLTSFYDDIPEQSVYVPYDHLSSSPIELPRCNSAQAVLSPSASKAPELSSAANENNNSNAAAAYTPRISLRLPLSPKNLAPLVIPPPHSTHGRYHQSSASLSGALRAPPSSASLSASSSSRFRSGSTPVESALRSARSEESPRTRTPFTPFTPLSAVSNTSTLPTPISATSVTSATSVASVPASTTSTTSTIQPPAEASRGSPKPWADKDKDAENGKPAAAATGANTGRVTPAPVETAEPRSAPPQSTASAAASAASTAASAAASAILKSIPSAAAILGHRRGQSESGSIMERGRPRKRSASREGSASAAINAMVAAGISVSQAQAQPASASTAGAPAATAATVAATTPSSVTASSVTSKTTTATTALKRSASKASKSAERRAFEMLPRGYKATEAPAVLGANETAALATQALQQAARFEVLRKEDVDSLSRELRNLDERTEYLRRTYTSLRAGRRNLHGRICQYLRSPRVAKFSHDSMLRQEEALAELDTSIDDWVTKLEQAENRRTRVRQKLLEHVAAAATLPLTSSLAAAAVAAAGLVPSVVSPTTSSSPGVVGSSESLQMAMGIKPPSPPFASSTAASSQQQSISTPPRSPTKSSFQPAASSILSPVAASSPSPQRPIVAQVPSTILEQPVVEEAMAAFSKSMAAEVQAQAQTQAQAQAPVPSTPTTQTAPSKPNKAVMASPMSPASTFASPNGRRVDVESIRVYAGDDVYALLADVENQITQMGGPAPVGGNGTPATAPVPIGTTAAAQDYFSLPRNEALSQEERRRLHRAHSQELLNGGAGSKRSTPTPPASPARPPPAAATTTSTTADPISRPESPADSVEIFLTSAVFRPERSILAI